jgi:hypothetical protein
MAGMTVHSTVMPKLRDKRNSLKFTTFGGILTESDHTYLVAHWSKQIPMAQYTVKFSIQDKILSIIFITLFAVMCCGLIKQLYRGIVVINCQPLPQEVICKVFSESNALEIPKTQLSRVETIEDRNHKNQRTERDILISTDHRKIPLHSSYATNRTERITTFIKDPQAKKLTIDGRHNFLIGAVGISGLVAFILFFIFKDAWIDPRRKRR